MTTEEFNILIGTKRGQMVRFARTILHSEADAEDVVADVVERLWRRRDKLNASDNVGAFAMSSTRNGCYDHIRKRHKQEEVSDSVLPSVSPFEGHDTVEMMRYALSRLEVRQREVVHLKDIEGYTTAEIAEIFELEEPNVRQILSRGRKALRETVIKLMQNEKR